MINWPNELIEMIAKRRCVIFLGAGVSNNSTSATGARPPTWGKFLTDALQACGNPKAHINAYLKAGDYLTACDIIREKLGDDWNSLLRQQFVDPGYQPANIHEHIFNLDTRIFVTPNFDKIFDRHALQASGGTVSIKSYSDEDVSEIARGQGRYILKIHGDIDNPHKLIFTRKQYAEARIKFSSVYRVFESLLVTNCFLFVGCGLNDPDVSLLLENYRFFHTHGAAHYFVLPKKIHPDNVRMLKETRNLKILQYDKRDNHSQLTESLEELVKLTDVRRIEIARNSSW